MRLPSGSRIVAIAGITPLLILAQACTVGPKFHPPTAPAATTYTPQPQPSETVSSPGVAGAAQRFSSSADLPAQWWALFHSTPLDAMVGEALAKSPGLEAATARLMQAQEELRAHSGSTKYPTISGSASVEGEQLNLAAYGIPFPNPSPFALLNGSIGISYALDLFGANRRLIEGLRAQTEYEQWQLEGARLMLAGNVVAAAIRQAQLRSQIDIVHQMIVVAQQQLEIAENRRRAGGASEYDVRTQQTLLAQSKAMLPILEQQIDIVNDQLAVLMGGTPSEIHVPVLSFDSLHLPEELPLSIPSSLVRQRPDIRAAEALLHEASAKVGVATANLYPQIVLSGSGGALGTTFTNGGGVWNVGASLAQPLYSGGALRAEKRQAEAAFNEANGNYRRAVLQAFQQVADTLSSIQADARTLQARTDAAMHATAAFQVASQRYQAGGISQVALLDAQRQQLQTALDCTESAANRFRDTATLFQALGGAWWNRSGLHISATASH